MSDYNKDNRIQEKITELLKYLNQRDLIPVLLDWQIPSFPINGTMIASKNIPKGPRYTQILNELRESWKRDHDLDTSEETVAKLLKKCDELI
jgi:hypothetical protein